MATGGRDVNYKVQVLQNWRQATEDKSPDDPGTSEGDDITQVVVEPLLNKPDDTVEPAEEEEKKEESYVVINMEDEPPGKVDKKTLNIPPRSDKTVRLGRDGSGRYPNVFFPREALLSREKPLNLTATTYTSVRDLPHANQRFREMFSRTHGLIGSVVELNDNDRAANDETKFDDFLQIEVPYRVPDGERRYIEVLRCHGDECDSLPTGFESRGDDNVNSYFIVKDDRIIIYTRTFSFYTCCKGMRNRLDIKAWVFGMYAPDILALEIRVYIAGQNPKKELIREEVIQAENIVLERERGLKLPDESLEFTQKDKLRFLLLKNTDWEIPPEDVKQSDKLVNLVECDECRLKSGSCLKDAAVFELVPGGNIPQPLVGLKDVGKLHIVVRPHANLSCWEWFKRKLLNRKWWRAERRNLERMPVPDELRMSRAEPESITITSIQLRINFSGPGGSDSGLGVELRDRYLEEQADSVFEIDDETSCSAAPPAGRQYSPPDGARGNPPPEGACAAPTTPTTRRKRVDDVTRNIPIGARPKTRSQEIPPAAKSVTSRGKYPPEGASVPSLPAFFSKNKLSFSKKMGQYQLVQLTEKYLRDNVASAISSWEDFMNIGVSLDFKFDELSQIRAGNQNEMFQAKMGLLVKWNQRSAGRDRDKAEILYIALREIGRMEHANTIFADFDMES